MDLSGVAHATIGDLELGKRTPRFATLRKLAATYDKPIIYFYDE